MRRILLISHAFPPTGGPGVQRAAKLVKYLARRGHAIEVISSPEWSYSVRDEKLAGEIPPGVQVRRTFSLEPAWILNRMNLIGFERKSIFGKATASGESTAPAAGTGETGASATRQDAGPNAGSKAHGEGVDGTAGASPRGSLPPHATQSLRWIARTAFNYLETALFTPDIYSWWLPFAIAAAARSVFSFRPDVIIATGGPFSSFCVAHAAGKIFNIPYILDYRDAWTLNPYRVHNNPVKFSLNRRLERAFIRDAAAVTVVTPHMLSDHAAGFPRDASKFRLITNGFDHEDFSGAQFPAGDDGRKKFRIVYTGTFTESRRPSYFLRALSALLEKRPDLREGVEVVFVGNAGEECARFIGELSLGDVCSLTGYVPHERSIGFLRSADALLLVTGKDRSEMTGKAFEYMRSKKAILALTNPQGSLAAALAETGTALVACHSDIGEIGRKLEALVTGGFRISPDDGAIEKYSREKIAGAFESLIEEILSKRTGR